MCFANNLVIKIQFVYYKILEIIHECDIYSESILSDISYA